MTWPEAFVEVSQHACKAMAVMFFITFIWLAVSSPVVEVYDTTKPPDERPSPPPKPPRRTNE